METEIPIKLTPQCSTRIRQLKLIASAVLTHLLPSIMQHKFYFKMSLILKFKIHKISLKSHQNIYMLTLHVVIIQECMPQFTHAIFVLRRPCCFPLCVVYHARRVSLILIQEHSIEQGQNPPELSKQKQERKSLPPQLYSEALFFIKIFWNVTSYNMVDWYQPVEGK
jgi:hypothetical protein